MSDMASLYPREFTARTVDPSWLLGKVRPVQSALDEYERWTEKNGLGSPVAAGQLLGEVFDATSSLKCWLDDLHVGESKAHTKEPRLCSALAILLEGCSRVLQEWGGVRYADDELRVVGLAPRADPVRFGALAVDQFALAAEMLKKLGASETDAAPDDGAVVTVPAAADDGAVQRTAKTSKIALALAVLTDHPDWTNEKIAGAAGCNVKYLSQAPKFKAARAVIRGLGQERQTRDRRSRGADMDRYAEGD